MDSQNIYINKILLTAEHQKDICVIKKYNTRILYKNIHIYNDQVKSKNNLYEHIIIMYNYKQISHKLCKKYILKWQN